MVEYNQLVCVLCRGAVYLTCNKCIHKGICLSLLFGCSLVLLPLTHTIGSIVVHKCNMVKRNGDHALSSHQRLILGLWCRRV